MSTRKLWLFGSWKVKRLDEKNILWPGLKSPLVNVNLRPIMTLIENSMSGPRDSTGGEERKSKAPYGTFP
jgi:hypothetical protein